MSMDKCKGCPYFRGTKCNGCGEHWVDCYTDKKHKDFMSVLDEIDNERNNRK